MREGFTTIPDWMLDLELDIYETMVYATIFGFSQDGETTFKGSQAYLARKAKCSKRKVANALGVLLERGLIKKIDVDIRGIHLCEYYCTICKGIAPGARGDECGATKNIVENINIKERENKGFVPPSIDEVKAYCRARNNGIDAEEFVAFYQSKGWVVGKTRMKDWKSAVITWEKARQKDTRRSQPIKRESVFEHNMREMDKMFGTSYHETLYGKKEVDVDEQ